MKSSSFSACFLFLCLLANGCSNNSNLEMEAEFPTKNLSYLNLSISRRKNGRNKLAIFNIYHVFAQFVKLRGADFCISSAYVTSGAKRWGGRGVGKQKKHEKKHGILAFKPLNPYHKRSD